jgi:hypothetical protein
MSNYKKDEVAEVKQPEMEESRRSFLKKAGKFAVYTPPAVMLLMKPSFAHMSKSYVGRPENCGTKGGKSDAFHRKSDVFHSKSFNKMGKSNNDRYSR